jgi:hypothetical protein
MSFIDVFRKAILCPIQPGSPVGFGYLSGFFCVGEHCSLVFHDFDIFEEEKPVILWHIWKAEFV